MTIPQTSTGRRRIAGERGRRPSVPTPTASAPVEQAVSRPKKPQVERRLRTPRPHLPGWLTLALGLVLAGVVVFDVAASLRLHTEQRDTSSAAAATTSALNTAPAQAEKAAEALLSYGSATLQSDADAAKPYLTKAYADTFQRTVDDFLAKPAADADGRVRAEVKTSGVISASPTKVEVLLFVDQTSTVGGDEGKGQTALNRVVLTMVASGDRWLVDDVTAL
jgi:Mce-associated membrane protein